MSLTRTAIERDRVTLAALAVVLAGGIGAYATLPRAEDPGFVIRSATVITPFPGAAPQRVEELVTDAVEKAVQQIPEVDSIESQSKQGLSVVTVNVKSAYSDMRPIWDELRRKVDRIAPELPEGVIAPRVDDELGEVFGTIVTLTGDGFDPAELKEIADEVRDELLLITDVAKVDIHGAQDERVFVEYSNSRLAELGLSPTQLRSILESTNIVIPGGVVFTEREQIALEPTGSFESVEELRHTLIRPPGRRDLIALEDIAEVRRGYVDPPTERVRDTGREALALAISMREGGDILALGEQVRAAVERLAGVYPIGVELHVAQFQPEIVADKIADFVGNLLQAVAIVMVVMLLTLGLRTGLVVASLIPLAIVSTFLAMSFLDIGIDQMSLAALIIALGLLVDNAIVMSESIMVSMGEGKTAVEAAVASADELRIPLLVSSLTTAAAFLPIYLAESSTGEYTAPIFEVVTITLLASWLLALTVIPLLCVRFLRVAPQAAGATPFETPFYRAYTGALATVLRHKWLSLLIVIVVFVAALGLFGLVPVQFFPPNDRATFTADLRLPMGTPLEVTSEVVAELEAHLRDTWLVGADEERAGITGWTSYIGAGAPRFMLAYNPEQVSPEFAVLLINSNSRPFVDELIPEMDRWLENRFPDLETFISPLLYGPPVKYPVEVRVSGRDAAAVFGHVDRIKERLARIDGTSGITDNWGPRAKKLLVAVDQARARRAGVTNQDVAVSLQTALTGFETTEYREQEDVIPVVLRSGAATRYDAGRLESLNVFALATGRSVPLAQVADIEVAWEAPKILRRNRLQTVTVQAGLAPGVTAAEVIGELTPWLEDDSRDWPLGESWQLGGESEESAEANQSIMEKLPIAGLIIVMLLVGQFNSVRRAGIVLFTIPLGLIGVVLGLLLLDSYFGFMTLLGVISLSGIVINNAIVLIDRIDLEIRDNGLAPAAAILSAAQRRLRPILLTTCTTLGGLLPLYLGGGPMWEPLAVTIMGGLAFATVLTLGVVPLLYSILFRVRAPGA